MFIHSLTELIPFDMLAGVHKVASDNCLDHQCGLKKFLSRCVAEKDESRDLSDSRMRSRFHGINTETTVQQVLAVGDAAGRKQLNLKLQGRCWALSKQKLSSGTLDAAGKEEIIREFMDERDIEALLQDSHGNCAMQNALNLLNDPANLRSSPLTSCAAAFIV